MAESETEFLLSPYQVLDLTDEKGLLCGKILADLGADVVQVEPPGGSTARKIGPFYNDENHPEKSLFWWAYAANKRGIALDLGGAKGRSHLKDLVKDSHFLIESFPPGYMDGLGLGYSELAAINPSLIMVSITPFGKDGPYAHYKAPDIVGMAMGGFMYLTGYPDRPPLRVSFPQFYLHGGASGATGAMIAHAHRALTGEGQHVDVSCQQAVAKSLSNAPQTWDIEERVIKRMGPHRQSLLFKEGIVRVNWGCKDGYVTYLLQGGSSAWATRALLEWMDEEGMGDEFLDALPWEDLGFGESIEMDMETALAPIQRFFAVHTKKELTEGSVERRILMFPVSTPKDILNDAHLASRRYFKELAHLELNRSVTYPGVFIKALGQESVGLRKRAPLIGEHNDEIFKRKVTNVTGKPARWTKAGSGASRGRKPLDGLKVLDFSWVIAGPFTTKYLAEHGATVVRIESSKRPDPLRSVEPYRDGVWGINRSGFFANYNPNKYGISVDMRHPRARELALRMVSWAEVVTENFTPGTMERWGLGYEQLKETNPGVVMFSTSMMGRGGPTERQPGFGHVLTSLAGLTHITGWPDREPVNPFGPYTDFIGPKFAVPSILAALDYRNRTGNGVHLDMSQLESAIHFYSPFFLDYTVNGREQSRSGNRDPGATPHGVYSCKGQDRWIAIACFTDQEWQALRRVIDPAEQGWAYQEQFSSLGNRKSHEDELDRMLGQWTNEREAKELMIVLQSAKVPAGVVNDSRDLFEDPQLQLRNHFQFPEHPELGRYATDRSEFNLSKTPGDLDRPAPLLGQHTEYALKELFGLSQEEYQSYKNDGVLE